MAGDKRILIDLLLEVAGTRLEPSSLETTADLLRAALLVNSSTSLQACARVDAVDYGMSGGRQGLMVGGKLLSDVFEALGQQHGVPAGLAAREPELTPEDWRTSAEREKATRVKDTEWWIRDKGMRS